MIDNIPYDFTNAYFRTSDVKADRVAGYDIPDGWWSRKYEYRYAMEFAEAGQVVADMGCGWHYRPMHDHLAAVCDFVYGVDHHVEVLDLPPMRNGVYIVADLSKKIEKIKAGILDRIFCVSVLEELFDYRAALAEFKRLLAPDGYIVLTLDMPYDPEKPAHELYKGIALEKFECAFEDAGLRYHGSINRSKESDCLFHDGFNLCVWHCLLKHAK